MHRRHLAPCFGNSVKAATPFVTSQNAKISEDVYVIAYYCSGTAVTLAEWVDLLYLEHQHIMTKDYFLVKSAKKSKFLLKVPANYRDEGKGPNSSPRFLTTPVGRACVSKERHEND
jgi:hypothetical protein